MEAPEQSHVNPAPAPPSPQQQQQQQQEAPFSACSLAVTSPSSASESLRDQMSSAPSPASESLHGISSTPPAAVVVAAGVEEENDLWSSSDSNLDLLTAPGRETTEFPGQDLETTVCDFDAHWGPNDTL